MKNSRRQNPFVLALAILGVGALIYGGWAIYQQHTQQEEQRAIVSAPSSSPLSGLFKPSEKPPPQ